MDPRLSQIQLAALSCAAAVAGMVAVRVLPAGRATLRFADRTSVWLLACPAFFASPQGLSTTIEKFLPSQRCSCTQYRVKKISLPGARVLVDKSAA
jgi:hypothetical protein